MSDDQAERIFALIKELQADFTEFKDEFNKQMYIGNGKPAIMTSIADHGRIIEDMQRDFYKTNNAILREKECREKADTQICKDIEPMLKAQEGTSFLKKHWRAVLVTFIVLVIFLGLILAGVAYINIKLPALGKMLLQIKLNGG